MQRELVFQNLRVNTGGDVDSAEEIVERENTQEIELECSKHMSWYTGH